MPKVSVIVPVYNVERYFDQCMQSLINQTCQDIEIVLVDDGSPDNCPAMCDTYRAQNPDIIKVIHQKNMGLNAAWNAGLDSVTGEWICFVDSDDWVELHMVEKMLFYAENNDADLHLFGHYKDFIDCSVPQNLIDMILSKEAKKNYRHQSEVNLNSHASVWSKLYRRSYLVKNDLRFYPKQFHSEDAIFLLYAIYHANKVQLHHENLYHYRMVSSSAVNKWDPNKVDRIHLFQQRHDEFVDKYFTDIENHQMKQTAAFKSLLDLARFYNITDARLTYRQKVTFLRKYLEQEPLKSAIKDLPVSLLPKRRKWQIQLIRMGLIELWVDLFCLADKFWGRKLLKHTMYK